MDSFSAIKSDIRPCESGECLDPPLSFPVIEKSAKLVEGSIEESVFSTNALAVNLKDSVLLICYQIRSL